MGGGQPPPPPPPPPPPSQLPPSRFPATAGIAGCVATKGKMLNIPNAYKDKRFNPAIDKETGFKTRSILCMPVTEADGTLLGVCQMVNKFEQMKKASTSGAAEEREKKYITFTDDDEGLLKKCCGRVAEALSALRHLQKQAIEDEKIRKKEMADRNRALREGIAAGGGGGGVDSEGNSGISSPVGGTTPSRRGSRMPAGNRTPAGSRTPGKRSEPLKGFGVGATSEASRMKIDRSELKLHGGGSFADT